jgi:hypothetical protein
MRRSVAGLLALLVGIGATGCGGGDDGQTASTSTPLATGATGSSGASGATGVSGASPLPSGPALVLCADSPEDNSLSLVAYELDSDEIAYERSYSFSNGRTGVERGFLDCSDQELGATPAETGWSPDFTQRIVEGDVPRNGILPKVISESGTRVVGRTESSSGFGAVEFEAQSAAMDDEGDVWWLNGTDIYTEDEKVGSYEINSATEGGRPGFQFKDGDWELVGAVEPPAGSEELLAPASIGHGEDSPKKKDPFGILPSSINSISLAKLLPNTDLSLDEGVFGPDRKTLYFIATSGGGANALYSVPASGGEPSLLVKELGEEGAGVYKILGIDYTLGA